MLVPRLEVREGRNVEGKRRIASAALVEVPQSGSLIIDSGSTALHLADMLDRDRDLTAITNHVPIGCVATGDGFAGPALGFGHPSEYRLPCARRKRWLLPLQRLAAITAT